MFEKTWSVTLIWWALGLMGAAILIVALMKHLDRKINRWNSNRGLAHPWLNAVQDLLLFLFLLTFSVTAIVSTFSVLGVPGSDILSKVKLPPTAVRLKTYKFSQHFGNGDLVIASLQISFRSHDTVLFETPSGSKQLMEGVSTESSEVDIPQPVVLLTEFRMDDDEQIIRVRRFRLLTGFHLSEVGEVRLEWSGELGKD